MIQPEWRRLCDASDKFNQIIDTVENRCMAVDGPVTPTLREMREDELRDLWMAVQEIRTTLMLFPQLVQTAAMTQAEPKRKAE